MSNIVTIIGHPNVGKSTFFNRLVERRKAITESVPGITRDRQYGTAEWCGKRFTIVDTGGYTQGTDDRFETEIRKQIDLAISEAKIILFIVDSKVGINGYDGEIASILRKSGKKLFLIANKADNLSYDLIATEFYKLGLGRVYTISAINGYGTGELLDDLIKALPDNKSNIGTVNLSNSSLSSLSIATNTDPKGINVEKIPKIAIIGRPNVGKSSLLNLLLDQPRSIVTNISGTTRDSTDSHYNKYGKRFTLVDTAGIRKKTKIVDSIDFYSTVRSIKAIQDSDVCIVMLSADQGLESQDKHIISLAANYHKGMIIAVNKWDLIKKDTNTVLNYKKEILIKLAPYGYIPIIFISVLDKQRIHKTIDKVIDVYNKGRQKIPTSTLNDVMQKIIEKYPPPSYKGKHIKIKYITQLPTNHIAFAFFSNFPQYIKQQYKSYLENQLRLNFDFKGVPIDIFFRKK